MNSSNSRLWSICLLVIISTTLISSTASVSAQQTSPTTWIAGRLVDKQKQPVQGAFVTLNTSPGEEVLAQAKSQKDGRYILNLPQEIPDTPLYLVVDRPHFKEYRVEISPEKKLKLMDSEAVILNDIILDHKLTPAFWIAGIVFIGVLVLIATGILHNTLAALVGSGLLFLVSYLGEPLYEGLFIFDFQQALTYVDWNVIFLIMGMMIVIAVFENTGIFQWLAFFAYRLSGGRMWILLPVLMLFTGVASAFLDNVTTMLLMTPITIQIAIALGISPLVLLVPEVMASNVIGVSTLVGTPTNILISSYANISFNDFLFNLTPGVLLAFVGLIFYSAVVYRKELASARETSEMLMQKLEERGKITEPDNLRKAGWVGAGMLVMFVFGEYVHLLPAVTALIGATTLLVWIRPDIEEMIEAVDWTTLVFFISLFIVVGGIQEVGLISMIADAIGRLVGENLLLAMLSITWVSALLSMVVANIPFTAAMLPVVGFLSTTVPGAEGKALFFCLSVGSAMGGNGSLIGASANLVTAGISDNAGFKITYMYFLKKGFPALLVTVSLASAWLLVRFL